MHVSGSKQVSTFGFGQDLQELVMGQERETSWESEPFHFEIIVQTYVCMRVSMNKSVG
jgi:hypothetical protein